MSGEIKNPITGGDGGNEFEFLNDDLPVRKLRVWYAAGSNDWSDRDLVKSLQVEWENGAISSIVGQQNTDSSTLKEHIFKTDEKVMEMVLYTGDRFDRLHMKTDKGKGFDAGGKHGTHKRQDLGNGILLGFRGASDENELRRIGSIFQI